MKKHCLLLFVLLSIGLMLQAKVILPKIFTDNMVLQRNSVIPVWGWARSNEKIQVTFNKQTKTTRADKNGKWNIRLDAEQAGGPYELTIKGENIVQIKNVFVGEVWICSGQSNMEWTVGQTQNAKYEIETSKNPFIRHIQVVRDISSMPKDDLKEGVWEVCDTSTVADFSAVGYFFAKNIYNELKIPIGIINSSWGGTNIETWINREAFENSEEFKEMIAGMPKINLDSLSKLNSFVVQKRIEALQNAKIDTVNCGSFKEFSFDDSKWPELYQPELWEGQSLGEFDGVVWLRKTIILSADDIKKSATLELSMIDDEDVTYVNGINIGSNNRWNTERKYSIPAGVLKEGKNIIAIRVVDTGGGGGIYGDTSNLKLNLDNYIIPLNGTWKFQVESVKSVCGVNEYPSLAFNAMINPIIPFAFQGVLWYQGESNADRAFQYRKAFPLLINAWRQKWNIGNFPFYFVQLATYITTGNSNEGCSWAELREAQTLTLKLPNTGMAVTTDIGNPTDIHPTNKQDVGKRLSAIALHDVYKKELIYGGPTFKSMEIKDNQIIVTFDNIGTGLYTPDKYGYIKGFEIAGNDQVFYYAQAFIRENKIILVSEKVNNPVAVHFGWVGDASDNNLFNIEGFPAIPFRTDDWKTVTKERKYKIPTFD